MSDQSAEDRAIDLFVTKLKQENAALQAENERLKDTNSKAVDVLVFEAAEKLNHLQEVNARHVLNRIDIEGQFSDLRAKLAASEERCKIYEDAFNELQNAILDAQHILDKEE